MISCYMQRKHYTLISVVPKLRKSTVILPGQALYHSHHGLVAGLALSLTERHMVGLESATSGLVEPLFQV
jgi:hypothetical protein